MICLETILCGNAHFDAVIVRYTKSMQVNTIFAHIESV